MALVETAPHEMKGHLVYTEHGASPYWLLGTLLVEGHGGYVGNVEVPVDGETWEVMLTDTDGGLAPREEDPVDEPLKEWQIKAAPTAMRGVVYAQMCVCVVRETRDRGVCSGSVCDQRICVHNAATPWSLPSSETNGLLNTEDGPCLDGQTRSV